MAESTTDHKVYMMTIVTMRGSAFGMARAAAKTAAMLRVPIPSDMTLRSACFMPKPKRYVTRPIPTMNRVIERRAKPPAVSSIEEPYSTKHNAIVVNVEIRAINLVAGKILVATVSA